MDIALRHHIQTSIGAFPCPTVFSEVKQTECEADNSYPYSVELKQVLYLHCLIYISWHGAGGREGILD
jgi:hypothetical protein